MLRIVQIVFEMNCVLVDFHCFGAFSKYSRDCLYKQDAKRTCLDFLLCLIY